jgi:serine/threonine protein kinase
LHESIESSSTPEQRFSAKKTTPSSEHATKRRAFGIQIRKPVILRDVNVFRKSKQVGQGTYGSVFMGADKDTGEVVALKRINTEQEENGFPITAIREVKILKALHHENIVKLREIVTSKEQNEIPKSVFMVFEYHEYDLTGILETGDIRLTQDHIKSWSHQLLTGVHYMHVNKIIHRDLKASNLLINRYGQLRIADWGLARSWNESMKQLTNGVVTLWYRPIELLLGCKNYDTKIDMWSVGCIIAEMFRRCGLLKGHNEASQLNLIFNALGHPSEEDWPRIHESCPLWKNYEPKPGERLPNKLRQALKIKNQHPNSWMTDNAIHLIENLLTFNPQNRWCALDAVTSAYFFEQPTLKEPKDLNMKFAVDSVHEWEAKRKHDVSVGGGALPTSR